jgi:hypothetical protein
MGLPWGMWVEPPNMGLSMGIPGDAAHYGLRQPRWVEAPKIGDGPEWTLWLTMGSGMAYDAPKMGNVCSFRSATIERHSWSMVTGRFFAASNAPRSASL